MHLLTLTEPVNLGKTLGVLDAGDWLCHDLNAFEIARMAARGKAFVNSWALRPGSDREPDAGTLVMRSGAIGDLLLLSPLFSEWMLQTNTVMSLCCFPHHFPLFDGVPWIKELLPYPLKHSDAMRFKEIISLENTMEVNHSEHATDVYRKALGLSERKERKKPEEDLDYRPRYVVTDAEKETAQKHLFKNRPNIAVQVRASVANRDYPMPQWLEVIKKLEQRGWGILLLGSPGQVPPLGPNDRTPFIRNLAEEGLTFRESAAVLSQCQAFVGVDSAWAHMCHALDIPAVVLFAAFDWKTRTGKAPKTIALTGTGECAPCNWHIHAGRAFPPNKPCSARQQCVVLAGITPERIVSKVSLLKP